MGYRGPLTHEQKMELSRSRFFKKVNKNGPVPAHTPELGPCWVWEALRDKNGYGIFSHLRRKQFAHRVSWMFTHGEFSEKFCLHKCDNPKCVRPDHLFEGDQAANIRDMVRKTRCSRPAAKLTPEHVAAIRSLHANGSRMMDLAHQFGVVHQTIIKIVKRQQWRDIP